MDYTEKQLEAMASSKDFRDRALAARAGYSLEKLVDDEAWEVRSAVARQGYGLDRLAKDSHWFVREMARERMEEMKSVDKVLGDAYEQAEKQVGGSVGEFEIEY